MNANQLPVCLLTGASGRLGTRSASSMGIVIGSWRCIAPGPCTSLQR